MLNRAIANFDQKILDQIHHFSIEILDETGIRFPSEQALEVFKKHGFRVDGETVFFTEKQVEGIEDHKPVNQGKVEWEVDDYHLERLKELGLGDDDEDELNIISRI